MLLTLLHVDSIKYDRQIGSTVFNKEHGHFQRLTEELEKLREFLDQLSGAVGADKLPPDFDWQLENDSEHRAASRGDAVNPAESLLHQAAAKIHCVKVSLRFIETDIERLRSQLERTEQQAERQAWEHKANRAELTARLMNRERELGQIRNSGLWKVVKPLWKLVTRRERHRAPKATADNILFNIELPAQWKTDHRTLLIKGWCFSRSGKETAAVRAKIGRKSRLACYGLERPDVARNFRHWLGARHSGFDIEIDVPLGSSTLRLEAVAQGGDWQPFFEHDLVREPQAFASDRDSSEKERAKIEGHQLPRLSLRQKRKVAKLLTPLFQRHHDRCGRADPVFSILTPTCNTKPEWLGEAALSILSQTFSNWEWCLVNDGSDDPKFARLLDKLSGITPRLRIKRATKAGISAATNEALDLATGEFVCFMDHDDLLDPEALQAISEKLCAGFDVVYTDEDKLDETTGKLGEQFFKPDWSPEYFRGVMYVGHLLCVRRDLAAKVRFDPAFDGVQDFDFMLRVSETGAKIGHIPEVLYHWRKTAGSIARTTNAKPYVGALQQRAVNAHLDRVGLRARAKQSNLPHRLKIVPTQRPVFPKVSIIIPTKNAPDLLGPCLKSLYEKTSYPNFETIVIDNQTTDKEALQLMREYPVHRISFPDPFRFSPANNEGARHATGRFLVFLNNDTEIVTNDWLQQMLYYSEQPDVGAVGALLIYENRTVQHAGVALGMRGTADHTMRGFPMEADGYAGSLACAREVSAVTAAAMMIRKSLFDELRGFSEHFFTVYQDVDLCLRLRKRGMRLICTPRAVVIHHESISRRNYYDMVDRMLLLDQWESVIERGDPYYNSNLNLERGDYTLVM